MSRAVCPVLIAWISSWISVAASGPIRWAPRISVVSASAMIFAKPVVSSSAQP